MACCSHSGPNEKICIAGRIASRPLKTLVGSFGVRSTPKTAIGLILLHQLLHGVWLAITFGSGIPARKSVHRKADCAGHAEECSTLPRGRIQKIMEPGKEDVCIEERGVLATPESKHLKKKTAGISCRNANSV